MRNNIEDVSNLIQQAMECLLDPEKPGDENIEKALAVAKLGSVQLQIFKVRIDYMKACDSLGLTPQRIPQLEPHKTNTLTIGYGKSNNPQDT